MYADPGTDGVNDLGLVQSNSVAFAEGEVTTTKMMCKRQMAFCLHAFNLVRVVSPHNPGFVRLYTH